MAPAFGLVEAKALLPYFMNAVTKAPEPHSSFVLEADSGPYHQMADKWSGIIENGKSGQSAVIDVNMWFGRATIDACVSVAASGVHGLQTYRESVSRKDRCWGFRVRFWCLRQLERSADQILFEPNVCQPIICRPRFPPR